MKILFYRYGSICEPDLIEQFKNMGIEVVTIEEEIENKKISSSRRIDLTNNKLSKESFLFVFSINFFPDLSDLCELINVPYVGWIVDAPVLELFSTSIQNRCNRIFCFDYKQYCQIHEFNPAGIFHLPLGTNVSRWDSVIKSISADDRTKFTSDISFVGSLYTEKDALFNSNFLSDFSRGYIDGLYNCQKNLQGTNIIESSMCEVLIKELKEQCPDKFLLPRPCLVDMDAFVAAHCILDMHCSSRERIEFLGALSDRFNLSLYTRSTIPEYASNNLKSKGGVSTLIEMPKIFNLSKINLNLTIHSIETGASLRVWDILGCNGFLLTNYQPELDNYLVPGQDYDYYTCLDELIDKCDYYLSHEGIRQGIALNGYNKVRESHCYANRFPVMFEKILNSLK